MRYRSGDTMPSSSQQIAIHPGIPGSSQPCELSAADLLLAGNPQQEVCLRFRVHQRQEVSMPLVLSWDRGPARRAASVSYTHLTLPTSDLV